MADAATESDLSPRITLSPGSLNHHEEKQLERVRQFGVSLRTKPLSRDPKLKTFNTANALHDEALDAIERQIESSHDACIIMAPQKELRLSLTKLLARKSEYAEAATQVCAYLPVDRNGQPNQERLDELGRNIQHLLTRAVYKEYALKRLIYQDQTDNATPSGSEEVTPLHMAQMQNQDTYPRYTLDTELRAAENFRQESSAPHDGAATAHQGNPQANAPNTFHFDSDDEYTNANDADSDAAESSGDDSTSEKLRSEPNPSLNRHYAALKQNYSIHTSRPEDEFAAHSHFSREPRPTSHLERLDQLRQVAAMLAGNQEQNAASANVPQASAPEQQQIPSRPLNHNAPLPTTSQSDEIRRQPLRDISHAQANAHHNAPLTPIHNTRHMNTAGVRAGLSSQVPPAQSQENYDPLRGTATGTRQRTNAGNQPHATPSNSAPTAPGAPRTARRAPLNANTARGRLYEDENANPHVNAQPNPPPRGNPGARFEQNARPQQDGAGPGFAHYNYGAHFEQNTRNQQNRAGQNAHNNPGAHFEQNARRQQDRAGQDFTRHDHGARHGQPPRFDHNGQPPRFDQDGQRPRFDQNGPRFAHGNPGPQHANNAQQHQDFFDPFGNFAQRMTRLFDNLETRYANDNANNAPQQVLDPPQLYLALPPPWDIVPIRGSAERMQSQKTLPQLSSLLKFKGGPADYAHWRDAFIRYVHILDIPIVTKLTQLHKALDSPGNPVLQSIVANTPINETGYHRIISNLETRFGQQIVDLVAIQIDGLHNIGPLTGYNANELYAFLNQVGTYKDSLRNANRFPEFESPNTLRLLQSRFTSNMVYEYIKLMQLTLKPRTVKTFLKWVKAIASAKAHCDENRISKQNQGYHHAHLTNTEVTSTVDQEDMPDAIFLTQENAKPTFEKPNQTAKAPRDNPRAFGQKRTCEVCDKDMHKLKECDKFMKFTPTERRDLLAKLNRCFRCLRKGHIMAKCDRTHRCNTCNKTHNTVIHGSTPKTTPPRKERAYTTIEYETQQSASESEYDQEDSESEAPEDQSPEPS